MNPTSDVTSYKFQQPITFFIFRILKNLTGVIYILLVTRDIAYKIKNQKHEIFHYTTPLRWILELAGFQFRIEHKAGKEMELPDLLSRLPPTSDKLYDWWVKISNEAKEKH